MSRVLIIGLDGADFQVVRPFVDQGKLPHLAALLESGAHGLLRSTTPPMSPAAWTSFMTGKNPGKHGVFDFGRRRAGSYELSLTDATARRAPAIGLHDARERTGRLEPVGHPVAEQRARLGDEGMVGVGLILHVARAKDERISRERRGDAHVTHAQRLRSARRSRRRGRHLRLDDVGRRLGQRLANRAGGENQRGAGERGEAGNGRHFADSFGISTFAGGPPISAPAG